ncbi:SixA phosphatase family protein [Fodinibius saliphilus]|uniref:SixA phosphatase family protein n=1 Tax=Fodinibius saliphilus TaxID=1920650 RepID=UPI001109AA93|nr:histidine phosphatase family protein [Fodinibius saliphilus]
MKTIMLLRHAQSPHATHGQKDFDRPLAQRGREDALRLGAFIQQTDNVPAHLVSSPAQRANETTTILVESAGIDESVITWDKELYHGGVQNYLKAIQESPNSVDTVLLVGHNPLLEQVVATLCNREGEYTARMSTASLVCMEHPAVKWGQVRPGTARFRWMMEPEILRKLDID